MGWQWPAWGRSGPHGVSGLAIADMPRQLVPSFLAGKLLGRLLRWFERKPCSKWTATCQNRTSVVLFPSRADKCLSPFGLESLCEASARLSLGLLGSPPRGLQRGMSARHPA